MGYREAVRWRVLEEEEEGEFGIAGFSCCVEHIEAGVVFGRCDADEFLCWWGWVRVSSDGRPIALKSTMFAPRPLDVEHCIPTVSHFAATLLESLE